MPTARKRSAFLFGSLGCAWLSVIALETGKLKSRERTRDRKRGREGEKEGESEKKEGRLSWKGGRGGRHKDEERKRGKRDRG